ncbi:rhomboid family intramembrane serine protease [Microbulbifer elongatus]|uniref:rhomboid family intramembrane serine protease n=1 Tax=Microbulbifer elongatus TaxID=86173 RepID=UPI001E5461C3|nr:rhomboid family intramembrane serine protease [Microbulbifer elongatus]
MNHWITVCDFPLGQDLSPVADFIRRHQLPLRITEENNHQVVASLAPQLVDPMRQLLARWQEGAVDLAQVSVHVHDNAAQPPPVSSAVNAQAGATDERDTAEGTRENTPEDSQQHPQQQTPEGATGEVTAPVAGVIPPWPLRQTPVSLLLIVLCFIGWFMLRQGWAEPLVIFPQPKGNGALPGSTLGMHLAQGEYWRLWSPAIVHFSIPHALFNGLGIWIVGRSLEARAGSLWFTVLVLISAPAANLAQYYTSPQNLFGGMSGVVYALIGCALVIQRWQPRWRDVPVALLWLSVVWLLVCMLGVVDYFIPGGIANAAHVGGFAAGVVLGLAFCLVGGSRYFAPPPKNTDDASHHRRQPF